MGNKIIEIDNMQEADLVEFIKVTCSDFLEETHKRPLYRGMHYVGEYIIGEASKNRTPKDNSEIIQNYLDEVIESLGGVALRKNSTFTFGNSSLAEEYSLIRSKNIYCCFPMNGYHYTWSRTVPDIIVNYDDAETFGWGEVLNDDGDPDPKGTLAVDYDKMKKYFQFQIDTGINMAISMGHEIWFKGKFIGIVSDGNYETANRIISAVTL